MLFHLKNLNCINCAAKIEKSVDQLPEVKTASLDFISNRLLVEPADSAAAFKINTQVRTIIQHIEPEVVVEEITLASYQQNYILEGLDCVNCASKIEKAIAKLPEVKIAQIDFPTQRLHLELFNSEQSAAVLLETKKIIQAIEPDVILQEEPLASQRKIPASKLNLRILVSILVSGTLLFAAIFFALSPPVNLILFIAAYLVAGYDIIYKAILNIFRGQLFDENFLMAIATIGAFGIGEYPEGVAVMLFYKVGELFQDLAVNRSRNSISALMDIRPDYANLKTEKGISVVAPEQVVIGNTIIIKPGEKIPLDGIVTEGTSTLDTSALTGESILKKVQPGDEILSGTINKGGLLIMTVTKNFKDSTVSKILDLVQNANSAKAKTENFITKFAHFYTPVVVVLAVIIALFPPIFIPDASFSDWIYKSLIFLVISCPCALVISIPLGFFGGIGGASSRGILIKGANFLEALTAIDTVVFDKTGTLTYGTFSVTDIQPSSGFSAEEVLHHAALAESFSTHPLAVSIVNAYNIPFDSDQIRNYTEKIGLGVTATISEKKVLVGNMFFMTQHGITTPQDLPSKTMVHVSIDHKYAGYIELSDALKPDAYSTIQQLKDLGVRQTLMLTGDNKNIAQKIAAEAGVDLYYSDLLPQEKVEIVEELENKKPINKLLLFVGDGINDAPVLARADVGAAMGGIGSDAAIEAADIVLMTDELSKLVTAIKIAKHTRRVVISNVIFAVTIKLLAMTLGILGIATIWQAVIADVGVTVLAVFNSLRTLNTKNL